MDVVLLTQHLSPNLVFEENYIFWLSPPPQKKRVQLVAPPCVAVVFIQNELAKKKHTLEMLFPRKMLQVEMNLFQKQLPET